METNINYCGDAELILKENVLDNSIDLVVTSPPYDNLRKYNGIGDTWNHEKFKAIAKELYRVIKEGGVIVWVVNDKIENGSKTLTSFRQALYFQELGFNINDVMIWHKSNSLPQVKQPRYTQTFEYVFIISSAISRLETHLSIACSRLFVVNNPNMNGMS